MHRSVVILSILDYKVYFSIGNLESANYWITNVRQHIPTLELQATMG